MIADNAAHKLDSSQLNAKQIETYQVYSILADLLANSYLQGQRLLDRKGDGTYEENTIIRSGLPPSVEDPGSPMAPIKSRVVQFVKVS